MAGLIYILPVIIVNHIIHQTIVNLFNNNYTLMHLSMLTEGTS